MPTKMLTLFNLTINFLSKVCGVTVILCSATQPCFERAAHPMFTQRIDMVPYALKLWDTFRRTQIQPVEMMRLDAIPAFAQRVLEQANSLLIVCNKKSEAAYLYKALSNGTAHCFHLSAGYVHGTSKDCSEQSASSFGCFEVHTANIGKESDLRIHAGH